MPMPKRMFKIPVIQMNCLVNARASVKYVQDKTKATARTKTNRTIVLVFSEKLLPAW